LDFFYSAAEIYSKMGLGSLVRTTAVQPSLRVDGVLGFAMNSGRIVAWLAHAVMQQV